MNYEEPKPRPWSARERGLIDWYRKARLQNRFPKTWFKLAPMMTIMVPERFFDMIDYEIEHAQAETIRALRNNVLFDLEMLHLYVEGKGFTDATVPDLFEDGPASDAEENVPSKMQAVPVLFE